MVTTRDSNGIPILLFRKAIRESRSAADEARAALAAEADEQ